MWRLNLVLIFANITLFYASREKTIVKFSSKYIFRLFKEKRKNISIFYRKISGLRSRNAKKVEGRIPGGRLARVDTSIASGEVSKG